MKIGIISDTHNNIEITKKAIDVFKSKNIELIVHAGDLTSPKMIELFKGFDCKFVIGNGDIDIDEIKLKCSDMGFTQVGKSFTFSVDGKKLIAFHGDNVQMFRDAVRSGGYDYIIKGHTHFYENYVSNNTRIINPGSLYGTDEFTVVILDTKSDDIEKVDIKAE